MSKYVIYKNEPSGDISDILNTKAWHALTNQRGDEAIAKIEYWKKRTDELTAVGSTYRLLSCLERLVPLLIDNIIKKHCENTK